MLPSRCFIRYKIYFQMIMMRLFEMVDATVEDSDPAFLSLTRTVIEDKNAGMHQWGTLYNLPFCMKSVGIIGGSQMESPLIQIHPFLS